MASMSDLSISVGRKIKQEREKQGKTQAEFAQLLDVNRATLSLMENGVQEPTMDQLKKISMLTGLSLNDLYEVNHVQAVVLDTNIILNRPRVFDVLRDEFDTIIIPAPVVSEINYRKDHGDPQAKKLAALCEGQILEAKKTEHVIVEDKAQDGEINDDRIFGTAEVFAAEHPEFIVYMLSNDKYFRLKNTGKPNLKVITSRGLSDLLVKDSSFNPKLSQNFFMAVKRKELEKAKNLSDSNIDVNLCDMESGFTPLIRAVRNKDMEMVKFLLTLPNIDINAVDSKKLGLPPVSHAIQTNNIPMLKMLLENGADVDAPSRNTRNNYNTPLMVASWDGKDEAVQILVEHGACLNQLDQKNGFSPLIKAAFNNHPSVIKYLLEHGADPKVHSFEGKTALDYSYDNSMKAATGSSWTETITLLRKAAGEQ